MVLVLLCVCLIHKPPIIQFIIIIIIIFLVMLLDVGYMMRSVCSVVCVTLSSDHDEHCVSADGEREGWRSRRNQAG